MLVRVSQLPPDKKKEFMDLVDFYKNHPLLKQTLLYSCHQDHLMGRTKHEDYDSMVEKRAVSLSQFQYHEYVSMKGDEILGIMYFITSVVSGKVIGNEMFVWRVAEKPSFVFGKDLNSIKELYEDSCHVCNEMIIMSETTKSYERTYGPVFLSKYPHATYTPNTVRCRDGKYRPQLSCYRRGNL